MKSPDIVSFTDRLMKAKRPCDVKNVCLAEMKKIVVEYPNIDSKKRILSRYRNAAKEILPTERQWLALSVLKLSDVESDVYARNQVDSRREDKLKSKERLIDADALILKAEELLTANSVYKLCLGLALVTGRRPIEIFRVGEFFPVDEISQAIDYAKQSLDPVVVSSPNLIQTKITQMRASEYLLFVGQAKTGKPSDTVRQPHPIPCLTSPETALAAIAKIRKLKPEYRSFSLTDVQIRQRKTHEDVLHDRVSKELNKTCKSLFGGLVPEDKCTAKGLRSAYAAICQTWFDDADPNTINDYFALILGHNTKSEASSESYKDFRLI
jgi:hypothetical protein